MYGHTYQSRFRLSINRFWFSDFRMMQQLRDEAPDHYRHNSHYSKNIMGGGGWYYVPKVCPDCLCEAVVPCCRYRRLGRIVWS